MSGIKKIIKIIKYHYCINLRAFFQGIFRPCVDERRQKHESASHYSND